MHSTMISTTNRIILLIFLLQASSNSIGSGSVDLIFRYYPNTTLTIDSLINSDMEMHFEGDENSLPQDLRDKFPIKILGKQVSTQMISTGESDKNGYFPIKIVVEKNRQFLSLDGLSMDELPDSRKLEGIVIHGQVSSDGSMEYISTEGADKEFESIMKSTFEQLRNSNIMSGEKVEIGQTVSKTIPLHLPIKTDGHMNLNMKMDFTLQTINEDIAVFNVSHDIVVDSDLVSANIDATLSGIGNMTYDINKKYSPIDTSKMIMNMKIPMHGGLVHINSINDAKTLIVSQ